MNLLFIHQNFPGQFKHLAPALAQRGDRVVALTPRVKEVGRWRGVHLQPYVIKGGSTPGIHPWLVDFETKLLRASACYEAALELKDAGFTPDAIIAHHGWGESLFLKDVWPETPLGLYCELYHRSDQTASDFDAEFPSPAPGRDRLRLRLKNLNHRLHEEVMDAGLSPTQFQKDTFPKDQHDRITVAHDGIDTNIVRPNAQARLTLPDGSDVTRNDEVITFINRNLEPYRGYHIFMRALPALLSERPNAKVVIIGGDEVSYGAKPKDGQSWKQIFIDEVLGQISDTDWARVHFLGRVPYETFLSVLQVSQVHVYLTYPFVLSWSLIEAMSAECAIVASATAPVREVLRHGETGVLVDFFDSRALVDEVVKLLDNPDTRKLLGTAARKAVLETYDLQTHCLPQQVAWVDQLARVGIARPPRD